MSTFYASFQSLGKAQSAVHELISGGVDPGDLSLVACLNGDESGPMRETAASVGDATAFVGRKDDPDRDSIYQHHAGIEELETTEFSRLSPLDTSNIATDVESIDQMDDPQTEMELESRPWGGISQGRHEMDEVALSVTTGFPTMVKEMDDLYPGELGLQEQNEDSIEKIEIPGYGIVIGGGLMATAALDFAKSGGSCPSQGLVDQLTDDGVPKGVARKLHSAFASGQAVLAVLITPGELNEEAVEEIAERHGAHNFGLFDAPRF
jgi:hypothetical protein